MHDPNPDGKAFEKRKTIPSQIPHGIDMRDKSPGKTEMTTAQITPGVTGV
jgi:hypothetical protein